MVVVGSKADKVENFHTQGVFKTLTGNHEYRLVQNMDISMDETNQDEDLLDDGTPMFSRIGDKIGVFSFDLKNTIDLFESSANPTTVHLMSYWLDQLSKDNPPEISFVETLYAPDSTGSKFARITFKARIRKVNPRRDTSRAIANIYVSGEIIEYNGAVRAAA